MPIWTLENLCIRSLVLTFENGSSVDHLPRCLISKLRKLREQMSIFERVHDQMLNPKIGLPILLTTDAELDWIAVASYCIDRYLTDTTANDDVNATKAFGLAAVNGLEAKCAEIWPQLAIVTRRYLLEDQNIPRIVKYSAWRICSYGVPYHSLQYDEACSEAAKNGWHYALQLWLTRIPAEQYDALCGRLILNAILHNNYHILHCLPNCDVSEYFYQFFPDGRITEFFKKLATAPSEWRRFANQIGIALLEWVPQLDINRVRRDLSKTEETAGYVGYIDLLLHLAATTTTTTK